MKYKTKVSIKEYVSILIITLFTMAILAIFFIGLYEVIQFILRKGEVSKIDVYTIEYMCKEMPQESTVEFCNKIFN